MLCELHWAAQCSTGQTLDAGDQMLLISCSHAVQPNVFMFKAVAGVSVSLVVVVVQECEAHGASLDRKCSCGCYSVCRYAAR
jgi:hypothetical protein